MEIIKHINEHILKPPNVVSRAIFVVIQKPLSLTIETHIDPEKAASAMKIGWTFRFPTDGASREIAVIIDNVPEPWAALRTTATSHAKRTG